MRIRVTILAIYEKVRVSFRKVRGFSRVFSFTHQLEGFISEKHFGKETKTRVRTDIFVLGIGGHLESRSHYEHTVWKASIISKGERPTKGQMRDQAETNHKLNLLVARKGGMNSFTFPQPHLHSMRKVT